MKQWKVTAAITTYKRDWNSIIRAIESILNQTYPVYELLLIDDNDVHSDFSQEIMQGVLKLPKVRYVPMGKNSGVCKARNRAIEEAQGDLIGFLDDDDEWHPEKVAAQVRMFEETPNLGISFVTGRILFEGTDREEYNWQYKIFKPEPTFEDMLWTDYVGSASVPLISMEALRDVGGFLTENQPAKKTMSCGSASPRSMPSAAPRMYTLSSIWTTAPISLPGWIGSMRASATSTASTCRTTASIPGPMRPFCGTSSAAVCVPKCPRYSPM